MQEDMELSALFKKDTLRQEGWTKMISNKKRLLFGAVGMLMGFSQFVTSAPLGADDAMEALEQGRFLVAHRLYQERIIGTAQADVTPETSYFAAKAAFGAGYYKVAKPLAEQYLAKSDTAILFASEAKDLLEKIDKALAAFAASDSAAFEFAQSQHTIFAYAAYRNNYPEGANIDAADFLSYRRAKEVNIEVSYRRYLEHWPKGKYVTEAMKGADLTAFKEARQKNLEESYQNYLSTYPQGVFREQAHQRLEAIAFNKARKDGSVDAIKRFLSRYPAGQYGAEARLILQKAEQQAPLRSLSGPVASIAAGSLLVRSGASGQGDKIGKIMSIPEPFTSMVFEVTFDLWDRCVAEGGCNGYSPSDEDWGRGNRPVINVSHNDITAFAAWFNSQWKQYGGMGQWRLPSETEWSYMAQGLAARSVNVKSAFSSVPERCDDCLTLPDPNATFPVGRFQANSFGLFDIFGNVAEWVDDCWHDARSIAPENGAPYRENDCSDGVIKGSTGMAFPSILAAQQRERREKTYRSPSVGFRLVMTQPKP